MYRPTYGDCTGTEDYPGCGGRGIIMTSSRKLCQYCDAKWKRKRKEEKEAERSAYEDTETPAGEYALFIAIAKIRPHRCFVTGDPVKVYKPDGKIDVWCMAHVLSKGAWPKFKLYDRNIVIMKPRIHTIYDRGNESERKGMEKYPGWHKLLAFHEELITEYNKK